jgi:oligoendopeptidase F
MTPAERKALWVELEGKFRPYMSSEGITYMEEGGRWQYQSHIYERPFYYIDYCLAQTVAFDFLIAMKKDYDDAFKRYDEFVTSAGSKYFTDLVKDAGFKTPFEQGALKDIIENVK